MKKYTYFVDIKLSGKLSIDVEDDCTKKEAEERFSDYLYYGDFNYSDLEPEGDFDVLLDEIEDLPLEFDNRDYQIPKIGDRFIFEGKEGKILSVDRDKGNCAIEYDGKEREVSLGFMWNEFGKNNLYYK